MLAFNTYIWGFEEAARWVIWCGPFTDFIPVVHIECDPPPYRIILFTVLWARFLKDQNANVQHIGQTELLN